MKFKKKWGGVSNLGGGGGGCEQRIEVFGKIHKKIGGFRWGFGLVGGQGECERNVGGRG